MYIDFNSRIEGERPRSMFGLSQVGDCARKLTYIALGYTPEPIPARTIRIFALGNKGEDILADEIVKRGHVLTGQQREVEILKIYGHIDGIIDDSFLWECKTANSRSFRKNKSGIKKNSPQYYDQITLYIYGLQKQGLDITSCFFTILNKDTSEVYQEVIPYDKDHILTLIDKISFIQGHIDKKELCPVPEGLTWQCGYCQFAHLCKDKPGYHPEQQEYQIIDSPDLQDAMDLYSEATEMEKDAKELRDDAKAVFSEFIPGPGIVRCNGHTIERQDRISKRKDYKAIPPEILKALPVNETISTYYTIKEVQSLQ